MTTDPRTTALAYLGPHLDGWEPVGDPDVDAYPQIVSGAVHEAGHAVSMAVLGIPGVRLVLEAENSGHVKIADTATHSNDTHAVVLLAGVAAQGELHDLLWEGNCGISGRHAMALGGAGDFAALSPGVILPYAEACSLAAVRTHWESVCRLARAVLDAPEGRLAWEQVLDVLGPELVGVGLARDAVQTALDDLATGVVERVTAGTIAGYDGP